METVTPYFCTMKLFYSLLFLGLISPAFSQVTMNLRLKLKDTLLVDKYQTPQNNFKIQKLYMSPGHSRIKNLTAAKKLHNHTIVAVELVYSDYPEGKDFSELNRQRIIELFKVLPQAFNNKMVKWSVVKQTGVKKTGGISNYFHGFAIHYREFLSYQDENQLLEDILSGKKEPQDSTLLKVFNRNEKWKNMLVVCDVTGSMAPYTAQLLLWIKANQTLRSMKNIVFFNDDDERSHNHTKRKDSTGMWTISSYNYKKVLATAVKAMEKGDHIENNLEAVCKAIDEYPEDKHKVLMIADNWEDPCDMHLLKYLKEKKIPVRIIVCGVEDTFNTKYLEIAHATGGTIHTMEDDLTNLASMNDGTTFKIGKLKYKMAKGKFYQVK